MYVIIKSIVTYNVYYNKLRVNYACILYITYIKSQLYCITLHYDMFPFLIPTLGAISYIIVIAVTAAYSCKYANIFYMCMIS